jgi:energy-coupling factor transport system permease protein
MASASYVAKDTLLHNLDARTKLFAMLLIFGLSLVFTNPFYLIGLLGLVLVGWWIAQQPFSLVLSILKYFFGIAVIIFVVQVLFYPGTTNLFKLIGPIPAIGFSGYITREGVLFAIAMILRLVVIMTVAPLLSVTTPIPELMLALVKVKIPYRFAFVMTTAMSLLPSIQARSGLIQQAQLCRGVADFEGGRLWQKLRAISSMLVPLILGSFRDSQTLDVAMSSRAFGAPVKRTFLLESHFERPDYLMLVFLFLLLLVGVILRVFGFGIV